MAASPMTRLPCISILVTINLDGDFRAGDGAQGAAGAVFTPGKNDGTISLGIIIMGGMDVAFFTGIDAKVAFLAAFEVDLDPAFFQCGCKSF
jgi:hypothetical protein